MASEEECRAAIEHFAQGLSGTNSGQRDHERTLSCTVPDLGVTFAGRLRQGGLHDISTDTAAPAQIRLTVNSDDLVALSRGEISAGAAWSQRRLRVDASFMDLMRLRSMF